MLKLYEAGSVVCFVSAAFILLAERETLIPQVEHRFGYARDIGGEWFLAYTGGFYVLELVRFRLGFGDVLITSTAGRATCMIAGLAMIPLTAAFIFRITQLLEYGIDVAVIRRWNLQASKRRRQVYILCYLAVLCVHLAVWGLILRIDHIEDPVSTTDIVWWNWQTMTTVGYGDTDVARLASNTLWRFAVNYTFAIFSMGLCDGFIAQCCLWLLVKMR